MPEIDLTPIFNKTRVISLQTPHGDPRRLATNIPEFLQQLPIRREYAWLNGYDHDLRSPLTSLRGWVDIVSTTFPGENFLALSEFDTKGFNDLLRLASVSIKTSGQVVFSPEELNAAKMITAQEDLVQHARKIGLDIPDNGSNLSRSILLQKLDNFFLKAQTQRIKKYPRLHQFFATLDTHKTPAEIADFFNEFFSIVTSQAQQFTQILNQLPEVPQDKIFILDKAKIAFASALEKIDRSTYLFLPKPERRRRIHHGAREIKLSDLAVSVLTSEVLPIFKRFQLDSDFDNDTVLWGHGYIAGVLANFLTNAAKYADSEHPCTTLFAKVYPEFTLVAVADNGKGISIATASQVFEKGYQGPQSQPGSGTGLAIAKQIIMDHNGIVGVHSIENQGTVFYFCLPNHGYAWLKANTQAIIQPDISDLHIRIRNFMGKKIEQTFTVNMLETADVV